MVFSILTADFELDTKGGLKIVFSATGPEVKDSQLPAFPPGRLVETKFGGVAGTLWLELVRIDH